MSEPTTETIDEAVRALWGHTHPGQLVTGWAVVVATTTEDDQATDYATEAPDWQPAHHTLGLLRLGQHLILNQSEEDE